MFVFAWKFFPMTEKIFPESRAIFIEPKKFSTLSSFRLRLGDAISALSEAEHFYLIVRQRCAFVCAKPDDE